MFADDEKAGGVSLFILYVVRQYGQLINLTGGLACNGCRLGILFRLLGRFCITAHRYVLCVGQMAIQPAPALGQGLLMGINPFHGFQSQAQRQKVVMNAQGYLAADLQR